MIVRITKEFTFEAAHALPGYDGACRHIHGHSYRLQVTIKGRPVQNLASPKNGMVMDFGDLKGLVREHVIEAFDHALILNSVSSDAIEKAGRNEMFDKVLYVDFQPTSENLLIYIADKLRNVLPDEVELYSLRLFETATACASWYASDNI